MNKDEMLEDMKIVINQSVVRSNSGLDLSRGLMALSLDKLGYRKVGEDEIVVKKSEYEKLSKTYAAINSEAYYCGLSVGREEVAKEILQELYDEAISYVCKVVELTTFQIEQRAKEKGIELEKDNGQRRNI